jgi:hypothetical protein
MQHLTRFLCAALITLLLCFSSAAAQSPDGRRAAQGSSNRVSVRAQAGAPLRISSVVDNSDDADAPLVEFVVENVGAKPIQAFWISYDTVAHGANVTLGMGVNANKPELTLPSGKRRALAIINRAKEKIALSVDFVEFYDGSTWGADTARYAESLAGERAGARAEAERLIKLLKMNGPQAVKEAIADKVNYPDLTTGSRSEVSFLIGVRATRFRAQQAYEKGGLPAVESALQQPYDTSAASLSR